MLRRRRRLAVEVCANVVGKHTWLGQTWPFSVHSRFIFTYCWACKFDGRIGPVIGVCIPGTACDSLSTCAETPMTISCGWYHQGSDESENCNPYIQWFSIGWSSFPTKIASLGSLGAHISTNRRDMERRAGSVSALEILESHAAWRMSSSFLTFLTLWYLVTHLDYPLVNIQKTMENHHFQWENPLLMAIFNSYFDITRGYWYHQPSPSPSPIHCGALRTLASCWPPGLNRTAQAQLEHRFLVGCFCSLHPNFLSGWWLKNHPEKYEFVNFWGIIMDYPIIMKWIEMEYNNPVMFQSPAISSPINFASQTTKARFMDCSIRCTVSTVRSREAPRWSLMRALTWRHGAMADGFWKRPWRREEKNAGINTGIAPFFRMDSDNALRREEKKCGHKKGESFLNIRKSIGNQLHGDEPMAHFLLG